MARIPQDDYLAERIANFIEAKDGLERAIANESDVGVLLSLADQHYTNDAVSRKIYLRILEMAPDHVTAMTRLGRLCWLEGDHVGAYGYYRKAARLQPEDAEVLKLKASLSTDWAERVSIYRRILELHPESDEVKRNLAIAEDFATGRKKAPTLTWPPGQHRP